MSLVAVWSPLAGGSGSTMLAAALPIVLALEYPVRTLLAHGGMAGERVEEAFVPRRETIDSSLAFHDTGMDALARLVAGGRLTPGNVRNYAVPLLSDRLDLLGGPSFGTGSPPRSEETSRLTAQVLEASKRSHDITVADAGNGEPDAADLAILAAAELVVVGLNQNVHRLGQALKGTGLPEALRGKPCLYVVGRYDGTCGATLLNLGRQFGIKGRLAGIPYCSEMADAWNSRNVLMYMQRRRTTVRRQHYSLYSAIRGVAARTAEELGLPSGVGNAEAAYALG